MHMILFIFINYCIFFKENSKILHNYETQSGYKVKKDKNSIYLYSNAATEDRQLVKDYTSIKRGLFPFKYLNYPRFILGKDKSIMHNLFNKWSQNCKNGKEIC